MIRAIVFDLDDTLYPERDYAFSGFAAVAQAFKDELGDPDPAAAAMRRLFDTPNRHRVFNTLLAERGLRDQAIVQRMVDTFHTHKPTIRLFPDAEAALVRFHGRFKLGLITDGPAVQQWAKIDALGLRPRLNEIIVTSELGNEERQEAEQATKPRSREATQASADNRTRPCNDEAAKRRSDEGGRKERESGEANIRLSFSKPHPLAFGLMAQRLGAAAGECAYVADNPEKDFVAPNRLRWLTVHVKRAGGVYEKSAVAAGGEPKDVIATLDRLDDCLALCI